MNKLMTAAVAATFALGTAASAATLSISGGVSGSIPDASQSGTPENNVLEAAGVGAIDPNTGNRTLDGFYEGTINLDMDALLKVEFIGSEAGFTNTFSIGGITFTGGGNGGATDPADILSSQVEYVNATAGKLNFVFSSVGMDLANGDNPTGVTSGAMNYFASFGDASTTSGDSGLWLFLDDAGIAGDNHDDLVVRISVSEVPLPAGAVLLLTGLGALGLRRRKA